MRPDEIAVFIDPFTHHFERDRLFETQAFRFGGDNQYAPYIYLRDWLEQRGVRVHTGDLLDNQNGHGRKLNVYVSLGIRHRVKRLASRSDVVASGFFAFECPVAEPRLYEELHDVGREFKRIFSYSTEEALRPFLRGPVRLLPFRLPQHGELHEEIWRRDDRQFLVMINSNKLPRTYLNELYTERLRAIEFFNRYGEIDLYGVGWDGPPIRLGESRVPGTIRRLARRTRRRWQRLRPPTDPVSRAVRHAYRGRTESKADTIGRYTFALCFENSILEGWVTEKLFDCFCAGTVPVYWGAPDIERWVPPDCFIDMRRFEDYGQLRDFLLSLGSREVEAYRIAARDYLRSEQYRPFTAPAFAELIGQLVAEDTGVAL